MNKINSDNMFDEKDLNDIQKAALSLIRCDLSYLYTVVKTINPKESNYLPSLLPYIALIIDGTEDWISAINNSAKVKIEAPLFNDQEKHFYETARSCLKLFDMPYEDVFSVLQNIYNESDKYFSNLCKPIAKRLRLYDIFGVDHVNNHICGNTILCSYYAPDYDFYNYNGIFVKETSVISGKYIRLLNGMNLLPINPLLKFDTFDYGGFFKSPVGNTFSDKFILFSIMCQVNFIIYCVDNYIVSETPTKLRLAYILYYYICGILPVINRVNQSSFTIDTKWISSDFRNSMAHYKLGVYLCSSDMVIDDPMWGITQKAFGCNYNVIKKAILEELYGLSLQIERYLHITKIPLTL